MATGEVKPVRLATAGAADASLGLMGFGETSAADVPGSITLSFICVGAAPVSLVTRSWTSSTSPTTKGSVPGLAWLASCDVEDGPWSASYSIGVHPDHVFPVRVRIASANPAGARPTQVTPVTAKPVAGSGALRAANPLPPAFRPAGSCFKPAALTPVTAYSFTLGATA
ncbi:MAG: hypothetical protein ABJA81_04135 [Nocardioidaceae bacterium]